MGENNGKSTPCMFSGRVAGCSSTGVGIKLDDGNPRLAAVSGHPFRTDYWQCAYIEIVVLYGGGVAPAKGQGCVIYVKRKSWIALSSVFLFQCDRLLSFEYESWCGSWGVIMLLDS